ncbi:hypothetical protein AQUCO_01600413v1 [Aquilegia coerulea]|uniref:Uncharacterized protein n=1 Tax=Aquilegia coerulea TaxID=218851 RepID=A0A2G5DRH2_AQUCA|nr:hypothetical protein AQUCO_01600413v1 [Aquilegia coerulea]
MEEDKKKKKNKKKKNKQTKPSEDPIVITPQLELSDQNHTSASQQNYHTEDVVVPSTGVLEPHFNPDNDHSNGTKQANLDEREIQLLLQKEAILEEKVKQLEDDKDSCIQREVVLEKKITDLQKETDHWLQKEASMDQKLQELLNEKTSWTLKGANLDDRIKQLENDKDSWIIKEANLDERIKQLENDKESWSIKENSTKDTIDRLTNDFMEVQAQVKVLQEFRDDFLQENQRLMERILFLQSQVQHLEESSSAFSTTKTDQMQHVTKDDDTKYQMEETGSVAEKLITEDAELVEKVIPIFHVAFIMHSFSRTVDLQLFDSD